MLANVAGSVALIPKSKLAVYYEPTNEGAEKQLRQRLDEIRGRRSRVSKPKQPDSKTES